MTESMLLLKTADTLVDIWFSFNSRIFKNEPFNIQYQTNYTTFIAKKIMYRKALERWQQMKKYLNQKCGELHLFDGRHPQEACRSKCLVENVMQSS